MEGRVPGSSMLKPCVRARPAGRYGIVTRSERIKEPRGVRVPTEREPTPAGEMLLEKFIVPLGITQKEFPDRIGVSYARLNEIVSGRRGVTPSTACVPPGHSAPRLSSG